MAEGTLQNAWKRYIQEGRNLREESQKQVETFVKRLVKEGELRTDQVQAAIEEINGQTRRGFTDLQKRIRTQLREELSRIGVASKTDFDRLQKRVEKVEKTLADQKKAPAPRAAAAAAPKAPAAKTTTAAKRSTTTTAKKTTPTSRRATPGKSAS